MLKRIYSVLLIISLCICLPGCSNTNKDNSTSTDNSSYNDNNENKVDVGSSGSENSSTPDNAVKDNSTTYEETKSPEVTETPRPESGLTETPEPVTGRISLKQHYSDENRLVKILGLKEYKKIKSEKYTDKAKKGNKFLVLFLSVENNTNEEDYINYNYISAKIDGKEIEHTFLVNDPKGYPTIFTHVPAGKSIGGFIVWEVPVGWKTLDFSYTGWKNTDNVSIEASFTPGDLSNPVIYDAVHFN